MKEQTYEKGKSYTREEVVAMLVEESIKKVEDAGADDYWNGVKYCSPEIPSGWHSAVGEDVFVRILWEFTDEQIEGITDEGNFPWSEAEKGYFIYEENDPID